MSDVFTTSVGSLTRQSWAFLRQLHAHAHTSQAFLHQSVLYMWCTRERLFYSFPAPIGPDLVGHDREKQLLLFPKMSASFFFREGLQNPSHRIRSFAKHLTCMSCGIMLGSVWPCRSWQKIHRDIVLAECLLPCQGTSSRKKMRATPQFTIHPEYLPTSHPRWHQGGPWNGGKLGIPCTASCPICSTLSRPFNPGMAGKAIAKMVEPWPKSTLQNTTSELNAGLQRS